MKRVKHQALDSAALDQWLGDKNVVHALRKVLAPNGKAGFSAIVGDMHCLVYDPANEPQWHYYRLEQDTKSWAIAPNSTRMWLVTRSGNIAVIDLRSAEWQTFSHEMKYEDILYAEKDYALVRCSDSAAVDVLNLQGNSLRQVWQVSFEPLRSEDKTHITGGAFLPEEERFLMLAETTNHSAFVKEYTLWWSKWDGQIAVIWHIKGFADRIGVLLRFPLFVVLDKDRMALDYADLRRHPFRSETLKLRSKQYESCLISNDSVLDDVFIEGEDLIAAIKPEPFRSEKLFFRIYPDGSLEKLHEDVIETSTISRLGRFLFFDGSIYDLVAQRYLNGKPIAIVLRQSIEDEAQLLPYASCAQPLLTRLLSQIPF